MANLGTHIGTKHHTVLAIFAHKNNPKEISLQWHLLKIMLSPVIEFLRGRYRPLHCDCCNHNFEVASVTSKESEKHGCQRFVRNWLATHKRVGPKRTAKPRDGSEEKAEKRWQFCRLFHLERARRRGIQRLRSESVMMHSEPTKGISSGK